MTRRFRCLTAWFFVLLFACSRPEGSSETSAADPGQPVQGDWVIVRFESDVDTLNPLMTASSLGQYATGGANNSQIFELLMGYNSRDWDVTEPLLAEAPPEVSDDQLTYTVTIREGVKWHDGKPFSADDVLFTFKAAAAPLTDVAGRRSLLVDIADIQQDGRKLLFRMKAKNVYNARNIANSLAIVAKHVFDPEGLLDSFSYQDIIGPKGKNDPKIKKFADQFHGNPSNRAPIGTGPFKFEKWESGREIVLTRNDDYWGRKPYLDKIVYRVIIDPTAALTALKAGELDLQPRLQPIQYHEQTGGAIFDEQFTKTRYSIPNEFQIAWNNEHPIFKDKRVRQAMTMLIDRQRIIDTVRMGFGEIGVSPLLPKARDFNPNIKPLPYDPKRAVELLEEAGWKDHNGDGVRDKDGRKFKFEFMGSSGSAVFKQLAPILTEEFRKAGIEMTERIVEQVVLMGTLKDHRFDATAYGLSFDLVSDQSQGWHSTGGNNFQNFKNAESDRLIEQARLEFDPEKRKQLYWRWQELIHEEQPVTFLYYSQEPAAISKRFQNVQWIPLRPGYDLTSWWVPKAQQKYASTAASK